MSAFTESHLEGNQLVVNSYNSDPALAALADLEQGATKRFLSEQPEQQATFTR